MFSYDLIRETSFDRNSFFNLKHFVVEKSHTNAGKMWQCLDEIRNRKMQVESFEQDIEELDDRIALTSIEIQKIHVLQESDANRIGVDSEFSEDFADLIRQENQIKIRQLQRKSCILHQSKERKLAQIKAIREEIELFIREFERIESIEPYRSRDDLEAQKEYWNTKLFREMNLRSLFGMPIDTEVIKTILSLHDDSPLKAQIIQFMVSRQEQLKHQEEKGSLLQDSKERSK